jgi:hypothetical protein
MVSPSVRYLFHIEYSGFTTWKTDPCPTRRAQCRNERSHVNIKTVDAHRNRHAESEFSPAWNSGLNRCPRSIFLRPDGELNQWEEISRKMRISPVVGEDALNRYNCIGVPTDIPVATAHILWIFAIPGVEI